VATNTTLGETRSKIASAELVRGVALATGWTVEVALGGVLGFVDEGESFWPGRHPPTMASRSSQLRPRSEPATPFRSGIQR
jgi:hypothetical protein